MENGPFIDGLPVKKWWFSIAMLVYQRVSHIVPFLVHSTDSSDTRGTSFWCMAPALSSHWGDSFNNDDVWFTNLGESVHFNIKPYTRGVPCETCFCIVDINNISCLKSLSSPTGRIIHKLPAKTCKNLVSCRVLKLHQTLWSAGKTYLLAG